MVLILPLLLIFSLINFFDSTVDKVEVPIVLVDAYEQTITDKLLSDMKESESFDIIRTTSIPKYALERGEVEAVFVLPNNLKEKIKQADLENAIQWYRNDRSLFDGLFKEQLASAIMTRAIRGEAANVVQHYQSEADWEEIYSYGLKYLEPEPIFQMQFETIGEKFSATAESDSFHLFRWMIWIYIWIVLAYLTKILLKWKELEIFNRLNAISSSMPLRLSWLGITSFITMGIGVLLTICAYIILQPVGFDLEASVSDLLMTLCSIMIFFILSFVLKKKETMWAITFSYGFLSSLIFFLIQFNIINISWWTFLFIPSWILV